MENYKNHLLNFIVENNISALFSELDKTLLKKSGLYRLYLNLSRRFKELEQNKISATVSEEHYGLQLNKVVEALIDLVSRLKETDLQKDSFPYPENEGKSLLYSIVNTQHLKIETLEKKQKYRDYFIVGLVFIGALILYLTNKPLMEEGNNEGVDFLMNVLEERFKDSVEFEIPGDSILFISDYHPLSRELIRSEIHEIDSNRYIQHLKFDPRPFRVYALDSREYEELVYDASRRFHRGTNAQEIQSILAKEPQMDILSEEVSPSWRPDSKLISQRPDLIVIHYSAFEESVGDNAEEYLQGIIQSIYQEMPHTRYLIYSRTKDFSPDFRKWTVPGDRFYSFEVKKKPNGTGAKSFMNNYNRLRILEKVREIRKEMGLD